MLHQAAIVLVPKYKHSLLLQNTEKHRNSSRIIKIKFLKGMTSLHNAQEILYFAASWEITLGMKCKQSVIAGQLFCLFCISKCGVTTHSGRYLASRFLSLAVIYAFVIAEKNFNVLPFTLWHFNHCV